jgi:hypothetical protein
MKGSSMRLVAVLVGGLLFCGSCDGGGPVGSEALVGALPDGAVPPTGNCRWRGYGIGGGYDGTAGFRPGQCDTRHLQAHAFVQCTSMGGEPRAQRDVVDQCADSQADEVQMLCCFSDGVSPVGETPVPNDGASFTKRELPSSRALARWELVARAADRCKMENAALGDWDLVYEADGVTVALIDFFCR